MSNRHPFRAPDGSARSLALMFRAYCWFGPWRCPSRQKALSRILEDV